VSFCDTPAVFRVLWACNGFALESAAPCLVSVVNYSLDRSYVSHGVLPTITDGGVASCEPDVCAGDQSGVEEDGDSVADEIEEEDRRIECLGVRYPIYTEYPKGDPRHNERNENEDECEAGDLRKKYQFFVLSENGKGSFYKVNALRRSPHCLIQACHAFIYLANSRDRENKAPVSCYVCAAP
jgi:hypothetical protein